MAWLYVTDFIFTPLGAGVAATGARRTDRPPMALEVVTPTSIRRRGARRGSRSWAWLQLAPATVYFAALFLGPLAILIAYSFWRTENYQFIPSFSLENYREVLTSPVYQPYFERTLLLALLVAVLVLVIAYPFAYALTFVFPRRAQVLYFLVLVSLFGGFLVRVYSWRTMLGDQGLINQVLMSIGLIHEPVKAFLNSGYAIVIVLVNFLLPLGVLPIYNAMQNVPSGLIEASRDLGGGRLTTLRRVLLPLTMRGVAAAFAFTFIATAAEWVTPQLVGGTHDQFVGNAIQYQFGTAINWPLGAALALTLIVAVVVIVGIVVGAERLVTR
jgi:spermidine/putrescine transport system permease protein